MANGRVNTIIFGKPVLQDRNEEELHGVIVKRSVLIHEMRGADPPISEDTILTLHRLARGQVGDAGQYKERTAISSKDTRMELRA